MIFSSYFTIQSFLRVKFTQKSKFVESENSGFILLVFFCVFRESEGWQKLTWRPSCQFQQHEWEPSMVAPFRSRRWYARVWGGNIHRRRSTALLLMGWSLHREIQLQRTSTDSPYRWCFKVLFFGIIKRLEQRFFYCRPYACSTTFLPCSMSFRVFSLFCLPP